MEENEQAILDWVNSFELEQKCTALSEMGDGTVLASLLHQICPKYFKEDALEQNVGGNASAVAGNLHTLLRLLDGYFQTELLKRIDMSDVDIQAIVVSNDPDEIFALLELVVGAAVMCENKAVFIRKIFELDELSQAVLKGLVEQVLGRAEDIDEADIADPSTFGQQHMSAGVGGQFGQGEDGEVYYMHMAGMADGDDAVDGMLMEAAEMAAVDDDDDGSGEFEVEDLTSGGGTPRLPGAVSAGSLMGADSSDAEKIRINEMLQHLHSERQRLLEEVATLEQSNDELKVQLERVAESSHLKDQQREAVEGSDRNRVFTLENINRQLQAELEELKREHDLRIVESETLQHELKSALHKLELAREVQAKLEMETHQQADELDIAKDKIGKLARAEQTIEKYQKKLEEMMDLKRQNKELSEQMDQYLDQIHELESANKGMGSMNKMVEQYKNRAVELETEKFEAQSALQMREQQVEQLNSQLEKERGARRQAQDECASLRLQLEQLEEEGSPRKPGSAAGVSGGLDLDDGYQMETVPSLKEKVKKLERELREVRMQQGQSGGSGSGAAGGAVADAAAAAATAAAMQEVECLRKELDDVRRLKTEREETLIATKKQLAEAQYELSKAQEDAAEQVRSADMAGEINELTQKLATSSNTVRLLQEKLKEKESAINKVEQEKSKLENYTKRSLGTFKDKYMAVLQTLKDEKEELQQKIRAQVEKNERNQDTWHREERLISSAMYELGVRIMDRKIQSQMTLDSNAPSPANASAVKQRRASGAADGGRKLFSDAER